jgi:ABC-type lipoprotein release transport system permease subunit
MLLSWEMALTSLGLLVLVGVATSTYPARRAADLPPVEALRFEM